MSAPVIDRFESECGSATEDAVSAGQRYISLAAESGTLFPDSAGAVLKSITVENPLATDLYLWLFDAVEYGLPNTYTITIPDLAGTPTIGNITAHALGNGGQWPTYAKVQFVSDNTLPAPLVAGVTYWCRAFYTGPTAPINSTFTVHGSYLDALNNRNAIVFTDVGVGTHIMEFLWWYEFTPTLIPAGSTVTIEPYTLYTYGILALLAQMNTIPWAVSTATDIGRLTAFYGIPGSH